MTTLVVTGATGYIGRVVCAVATRRGLRVLPASRHPPGDGAAWLRYDLASELHADDFPAGAVVVHLAAATAAASTDDNAAVDLAAAERLLAVARERALDVIFVSSVTAHRDAPTAYGRAKGEIETRVIASGGRVVRPGLVYGGAPGGVFAALVDVVRRLPVVPAIVLPAPRVQPIHVVDLAEAIVAVAMRVDREPVTFDLAGEPVPFTRFLRALARERLRLRRLWVPVPATLVALGAGLLGALGRAASRERLRSLLDLPAREGARDLTTLGIAPRPLVAGLHPSGDDRRRGLLREGRTLLHYALRAPPPAPLVRRYARWLEATRAQPRAMPLPEGLHRWPFATAWLDPRGRGRGALAELDARIDAAVAIAEASPLGAERFLSHARGGWMRTVLAIAGALAGEAAARVGALVAAPRLARGLRAPRAR